MRPFDYVKYDDEAAKTQAVFKNRFEALYEMMDGLPSGRSKSLAQTKLEEAYMWLGKAIRDDQLVRAII